MAIILVAIIVYYGTNQNGDCDESLRPRSDDIRLAACPRATTAAASEPVSSETRVTEGSSTTAAGGGAGDGDGQAPPPSSIPPGAILFQGQSGDQIGCIACDGAARYVALGGPGVVVGEAAAMGIAKTWDVAGHVTSFGATLHTASNKDGYGMSLFRLAKSSASDNDSPYRAGCAIEIGQTSCTSQTAGSPVLPGDIVAIGVNEAGTGTGDYSFDWWFVFQPDA